MDKQTGWFGNLTTGLGQLATSAAPLVEAFRGVKAPVANASPDLESIAKAAALAEKNAKGAKAGLTTQGKIILGGALLALAGLVVWLMTRKKG